MWETCTVCNQVTILQKYSGCKCITDNNTISSFTLHNHSSTTKVWNVRTRTHIMIFFFSVSLKQYSLVVQQLSIPLGLHRQRLPRQADGEWVATARKIVPTFSPTLSLWSSLMGSWQQDVADPASCTSGWLSIYLHCTNTNVIKNVEYSNVTDMNYILLCWIAGPFKTETKVWHWEPSQFLSVCLDSSLHL